MDTLSESVGRIVSGMNRIARDGGAGNGVYLGSVLQAGGGNLRIACNGLQLSRQDIWLAPGLDYGWTEDDGADAKLRTGDRVILFTGDGQDYYLLTKAVRA